MAAFFRMILFVLVVEAVFYVLLRIYLRSSRREQLEEVWDTRHPELAGNNPARREFVRKLMVGFDKTLTARLLWLVFILPTVMIMGIVWWVNWQ